MEQVACIILAAGLGKRMGLSTPKVVVEAGGIPLIQYVMRAATSLSPEKIVVVTGSGAELVEGAVRSGASGGSYSLEGVSFARQEKQLGTGDAVKSALPMLQGFSGTVVILSGDMPLVSGATMKHLVSLHHREKATLTLTSTRSERYADFGRIIRDGSGSQVAKIVEARDCSPAELAVTEVNCAIYAVDSSFLDPAIRGLENKNVQQEYYLTDIVERSVKEGQATVVYCSPAVDEFQGVNTRYDLALVEETLRMRRVKELTLGGVIIEDLRSVYIDPAATIEAGVRIGPSVTIIGPSKIAAGVVIEGNARIKNCLIEEGATIRFSTSMEDAKVGPRAHVGPFAHLRPGTVLEAEVKVGNFVETKKATLKQGAKASHLSYIGDATVGEDANIGAGTITCNYDGYAKHETKIGKGAFIGSNSSLVAPVLIEDGATVGAGSVITKTVEKDSLAFTRAPMVTKSGWSRTKRQRTPQ